MVKKIKCTVIIFRKNTLNRCFIRYTGSFGINCFNSIFKKKLKFNI